MNCGTYTVNPALSDEDKALINEMVATFLPEITEDIEGSVSTRPATADDVTADDISELLCKQLCSWIDRKAQKEQAKPQGFNDKING